MSFAFPSVSVHFSSFHRFHLSCNVFAKVFFCLFACMRVGYLPFFLFFYVFLLGVYKTEPLLCIMVGWFVCFVTEWLTITMFNNSQSSNDNNYQIHSTIYKYAHTKCRVEFSMCVFMWSFESSVSIIVFSSFYLLLRSVISDLIHEMNVYVHVRVCFCVVWSFQANWLWSENIRFVYHLTKADFYDRCLLPVAFIWRHAIQTLSMVHSSLCVRFFFLQTNQTKGQQSIGMTDRDTVSQHKRKDYMHDFACFAALVKLSSSMNWAETVFRRTKFKSETN